MRNFHAKLANKHPHLLATVICFLAAMFYLYEFILQVSPSVMTTELMRDLHIDAAGLGTMAAFYFYAYTPTQLPAGLLYDRFGPRRVMSCALLLCACGALFFGTATSAALASAGRFFMGIGSAFSFIGALLLVSRWFPPKYFALLAGIVQLMSSVGAVIGQVPIAKAVETFGWRETTTTVALTGFIISLVVWLVVKDYPSETAHQYDKTVNSGEMKHLRQVLHHPQTWLIALYSFTSWAPITVFAILWGVPFLASLYNISTTQASTACSMVWVGIGVGSPLIGWWSDRIGKRCLPLAIASVLGIISITGVLYLPHISYAMTCFLLFILGIAASGQSLSFALVKDNNLTRVVGTAIGFNNMAVVAGGALFQPLVGLFLRMHWDGTVQQGVPFYTVADYRLAMCILPICFLGGLVISLLWLRETYCKPLYTSTP